MMGASAKQLAQHYLGEAQKNPDARQEIFRQAAYTFMGLAQDPKNLRSSRSLSQIGLDFAAAATREQQSVSIDDFTDLLQETAQSYHEVGDDEMDLIARRRQVHDERTPTTPGQIFVTPESFNRDATLGRQTLITYAPTTDQVAQGITQSSNVAFWQGTKRESCAMTVDVSVGALPLVPNNQDGGLIATNGRPYAEVEFGSDGTRSKFQCDMILGQRLTVVGNYIAVTVGMRAPSPNSESPVLMLGASIGAFAAPVSSPVTYTVFYDAVLATTKTTGSLPIPARAVLLLPPEMVAAVGAAYEIDFLDLGGNTVSTVYYEMAANSPARPIPVPADAASIELVNTGASPIGSPRFPFQLSI